MCERERERESTQLLKQGPGGDIVSTGETTHPAVRVLGEANVSFSCLA